MQNKKKQLWLAISLPVIMFFASPLKAQVTIGALGIPNATLDVRSQSTVATVPDGIIAPKLTGDQLADKSTAYGANQDDALVYVTAAASVAKQTGKTINVKAPGYYYYNAASNVWTPLAKGKPEWFYMPPAPINTDAGTAKTINLFNACSSFISGSVKSGGAVDFSTICPVLTASDYYYYVVGYDNTLFSNISIDPTTGIMTYDSSGNVTDQSYINIIFARK